MNIKKTPVKLKTSLLSAPSVRESGFTMIELLIVGMVIAILAGSVSSVINYQRHRQRTDDAVRRATLLKLVNVIETYRTSESRFPPDPNSDGNPEDAPLLSTYLGDGWPNNFPVGAVYSYWVNSAGTIAGITVNTNEPTVILKFRSTTGEINDCAAPAVPSDDTCN